MASAHTSLVSLDRTEFIHTIEGGLEYTVHTALLKDNHYTLFRSEDWAAWVIFSIVFAVLIVFDNCVLNRNHKKLTVMRAMTYTLFWIFCAFAFCGWIAWWKGTNAAFSWMSGYMLEWMLSFDNLFVFHLIFNVYGTPDHLKHKPLYYGICGAVFFRLLFIFVGEYLMHALFFMHIIFGCFLVYTGVQTAISDEDDEDPSQHWFVVWLTTMVPFVSAYDRHGRFFVSVPVDAQGEPVLDDEFVQRPADPSETDALVAEEESEAPVRRVSVVDFAAATAAAQHAPTPLVTRTRATMLFLVVVCLEVSDVLFAVDSVSAIVAQVPDLFLAYTSAVFAMLGLRATFFIIDVLVQLFSLLKYGVSAVLVFIGIKLCLSRVVHIPAGIVCMVLVLALGSSMIASVVQEEFRKRSEGKIPEEIIARVEKVTNSPHINACKTDKVV